VYKRQNVLCVGARVIGTVIGESVVDAFINAVPSQEERFIRRLNKMKALES
jgi:ribose 5-phosphate isomerase RpiB